MMNKELRQELSQVVKNQFAYANEILGVKVKVARAYMNPRLESFKDVEWTDACLKTQEALEGTVVWSLDWFDHGRTVTDKFGVTHSAQPLYLE